MSLPLDEEGRVVKQTDHLMDATRYLIMSGRERMKTKPKQQTPSGSLRRAVSIRLLGFLRSVGVRQDPLPKSTRSQGRSFLLGPDYEAAFRESLMQAAATTRHGDSQ